MKKSLQQKIQSYNLVDVIQKLCLKLISLAHVNPSILYTRKFIRDVQN